MAIKKLNFLISKGYKTEINNENEIHQDCVIGVCRAKDGKLWATAGHMGYGHIGVFCGDDAATLKELYPAKPNFKTGKAGDAFCGTRYPDGPRARGEYWATGLWIDPETGIFHAFVHNETGWSAGESAYTAYGQCEGEPDFRHVAYITSQDQGQTWDFQRWVLTAYETCYAETYRPDGLLGGQRQGIINLGSGDLSVFYNEADQQLYMFYSMVWYDMDSNVTIADKVYVARAELNSAGYFGDFTKYFDGAFCEPGNSGRESAVVVDSAEPCVAYSKAIDRYIMTSYNRASWMSNKPTLFVAYSDDLVNWTKSEPCLTEHDELSLPYFTLIGRENGCAHNILGSTFDLLANTNNTDVMRFEVTVTAEEQAD